MIQFKMGADVEAFYTLLGRIIPFNQPTFAFGGGHVTKDGPLIELIFKPESCRDYFSANVRNAMNKISLNLIPVHNFKKLSQSQKSLGCSPSQNIYDFKGDLESLAKSNTRTIGGHIHISANFNNYVYTNLDFTSYDRRNEIITFEKKYGPLTKSNLKEFSSKTQESLKNLLHHQKDFSRTNLFYVTKFPVTLIRLLDILVGNVSVIFAKYPDLERKRREFYGQAGEYRPKPYGIEYRVPSAQIIANPVSLHTHLGAARLAMNIYHENRLGLIEKLFTQKLLEKTDSTIEAIMLCNKELAFENLHYVFKLISEHNLTSKYSNYKSSLSLKALKLYRKDNSILTSHNWSGFSLGNSTGPRSYYQSLKDLKGKSYVI